MGLYGHLVHDDEVCDAQAHDEEVCDEQGHDEQVCDEQAHDEQAHGDVLVHEHDMDLEANEVNERVHNEVQVWLNDDVV